MPNHLVIQVMQAAAELDGAVSKDRAMRTKRLTELALLAAIALTVFTAELRIPNPLPVRSFRSRESGLPVSLVQSRTMPDRSRLPFW